MTSELPATSYDRIPTPTRLSPAMDLEVIGAPTTVPEVAPIPFPINPKAFSEQDAYVWLPQRNRPAGPQQLRQMRSSFHSAVGALVTGHGARIDMDSCILGMFEALTNTMRPDTPEYKFSPTGLAAEWCERDQLPQALWTTHEQVTLGGYVIVRVGDNQPGWLRHVRTDHHYGEGATQQTLLEPLTTDPMGGRATLDNTTNSVNAQSQPDGGISEDWTSLVKESQEPGGIARPIGYAGIKLANAAMERISRVLQQAPKTANGAVQGSVPASVNGQSGRGIGIITALSEGRLCHYYVKDATGKRVGKIVVMAYAAYQQ